MTVRDHKPSAEQRSFGVLLHLTSLPGAQEWGALGRAADHFLDWLQAAGATVWQILPVRPVGDDGSPYYARSSHAGNPNLIDLELLADAGLLTPEPRVDQPFAVWHARQVREAARTLLESRSAQYAEFEAWCAGERAWLDDYALYRALAPELGGANWTDWPPPLRDREPTALHEARARHAEQCAAVRAEQYFFHSQWQRFRQRAAAKGVLLFGDLPFYVAPDSVDTWVHRELFQLDKAGRPTAVAGVPPDYFSEDGQLWGNPLYRWEAHERSQFAWWLDRFAAELALCDRVRLDHFRALEAYWSVPFGEKASAGQWIKAPGAPLLAAARRRFGALPLVAEDLGVITPAVDALRTSFGLPGMRLLQFAFGGDATNPHLPHNWTRDVVAYTGTHDNDTLLGWLALLDEATRSSIRDYAGPGDSAEALMRVLMGSVAQLVIVPMQDLLRLGSASRMNLPGTVVGNWNWRLDWSGVPSTLAARTRHMAACFGRT